MQCPRCYGTDVSPVGNTHYICNNKKCRNEDGKPTQFLMRTDKTVKFPYNQIFIGRSINEFYKKQYLKLKPAGTTTV